jgi:NAD(P)-dependent dehydrogenase (short-subunit alcohol dehydrogenase family)
MSHQAILDARLAGKVAIIIGGSRGIGAAIAKRLAADGGAAASATRREQGLKHERRASRNRH